jgi:hypothetical protein
VIVLNEHPGAARAQETIMSTQYFENEPFLLREDYEQTWESERRSGSMPPPRGRPSHRSRLPPSRRRRPRPYGDWPVPMYFPAPPPSCTCSQPATPPAVSDGVEPAGAEEFEGARPKPRAGAKVAPGASFRYAKDLSGPASECVASLKRAGKTRAQALTIINTQVGVAITMLRKAAKDLKRGSRSSTTKDLFRKIFRVTPEFVPTWLKQTATIKDRGDVVATRCARVADLLASGGIRYFCRIAKANCPDCSDGSTAFACSSWGDESVAPKNSRVVCLGGPFWDDMKAGRTASMLSTLMHEPFHIYYGKYVTAHRADPGKFGGINCIVQFVFETNSRFAPGRVSKRCTDTAVRQEIGDAVAGESWV